MCAQFQHGAKELYRYFVEPTALSCRTILAARKDNTVVVHNSKRTQTDLSSFTSNFREAATPPPQVPAASRPDLDINAEHSAIRELTSENRTRPPSCCPQVRAHSRRCLVDFEPCSC